MAQSKRYGYLVFELRVQSSLVSQVIMSQSKGSEYDVIRMWVQSSLVSLTTMTQVKSLNIILSNYKCCRVLDYMWHVFRNIKNKYIISMKNGRSNKYVRKGRLRKVKWLRTHRGRRLTIWDPGFEMEGIFKKATSFENKIFPNWVRNL